MSLSRFTVSGTVKKKPEKRFTPSNVPVTNILLTVTYVGRGASVDGEIKLSSQTVKVNAWRDLADLAETLNVGDKVITSGRIQINSYMANDGVRKREVEIDANSLVSLEKLKEIIPPENNASDDHFNMSSNNESENISLDNAEEVPF